MQQLELKDPAAFASEFLRQTQLQGFGALSKRDLELLVFVLLERDGAIDRNASNLQRWERRRLSDNTVSAHAFEAINTVFSNAHPVPTLLRGHLLGLAGRLPPLKRALWRHAAGL